MAHGIESASLTPSCPPSSSRPLSVVSPRRGVRGAPGRASIGRSVAASARDRVAELNAVPGLVDIMHDFLDAHDDVQAHEKEKTDKLDGENGDVDEERDAPSEAKRPPTLDGGDVRWNLASPTRFVA